jgi:hypothetical protein
MNARPVLERIRLISPAAPAPARQTQVVEGLSPTDRTRTRPGSRPQAVEAAGDAFPAPDRDLGQDGERQRHHGQIQARYPDRRQADHQADHPVMQAAPASEGPERHALAQQPGMCIGADGDEGGVPQRYLSGVTHQHHQPEAGDAHDEQVGDLADVILGQHPGRDQQRQQQQARRRCGLPGTAAGSGRRGRWCRRETHGACRAQTRRPWASPSRPRGHRISTPISTR